jgi:hypothetical protein
LSVLDPALVERIASDLRSEASLVEKDWHIVRALGVIAMVDRAGIPPHISLLYTLDRNSQTPRLDFDAERLRAIAAGCTEAIDDAHFTLAGPVVNNAGGGEQDVHGWNVIRSL